VKIDPMVKTTADALTTMDYRMAAEAITDALVRPMTQDRRAAMVIAERRLAHAEEVLRRAIAGPILPIAEHVLNHAGSAVGHAIEFPHDEGAQAEALVAMRLALEAAGCIVLPPWHKK
jgi:hypothetical protein